AGTTDPNNGNNSGSDTDTVTRSADLSATKDDGVASVVAGTSTTYIITVKNSGPSDVTGATVADVLPAGLTFISGSAGVSYDSGTNTVHYTTGTLLGNGGTESCTVTVGVAANFAGSTLSNSATVTPPAGTTDPTPGNNTGSDSDAVTRSSDLSLTKSNGATSVVAGTQTTYTLTITN